MASTLTGASWVCREILKLYIYGYLNQVSSSRRLEREAQRNVEVMWLTGRLAPDFKTVADFRRDNGPAIRATCRQFIALCRQLDLFAEAIVAIDGSRFKAVNTRDKNFTRASIKRRMEQVEASIDRYLSALATADRHDSEIAQQKSVRLKDKLASLREQMRAFKALEVEVHAAPDQQISLTDPDARAMATNGKGTGMVGYNVQTAVDPTHHLIVAHEVDHRRNLCDEILKCHIRSRTEAQERPLSHPLIRRSHRGSWRWHFAPHPRAWCIFGKRCIPPPPNCTQDCASSQ
jgi:hypothetical protein